MERSVEGRRSNLAQSNGLPKRRQRSNNLMHAPDGEMEMHETVRLRERTSNRDMSNRSKRRRPDKVDVEESTEESSGEEEEENETDHHPSSRKISGQPNHLKATTDEIISFPVPRKARSVSVKRSHENWVAGNGGYLDEQNHLRASVSPSSSNGSIRKKMMTNRSKTRLPKPAAKSSSSVQEDIEIEIAEVLYGLMQQSQSSKEEDSVASKKKKVEAVDSMKVENEQQAEMNISSPKKGRILGLNAVISDNGDTKTESVVTEKQGDSKPSVEEEPDSVDRAVAKEKSVGTEKESVDIRNPTLIKQIYAMTKEENRHEEKFKIDLMAPPMASSSSLDRNYKVRHIESKVETSSKDEPKVARADDIKGKKMDTNNEKRDLLSLSLGKPDQAPGYMPPFQTIAPMDASARSSTALQPQPRPKRCVMHQYIAQNIQSHQQYAKANHFWPPTIGSAALSGANPNHLNVPSTETSILGNPLLNLSPTEEKSKVAASFTGLTGKDRSSGCTNDTAKRQQGAVQQASQPVSASTLKHGHAFIFPMSPYQTTVNQSGSSKSATSTSKASSTDNVTPSFTVLPGVAAAVSFNYPNLAANQAPYLTIVQNNGYPFSISAPAGNLSAIGGGTPGQALPFFNGSFHSSQMFHPQLQQQQACSQPAYQKAVPSSGSSSSHKQPESQKPRGGQVCGNNFLRSTSMHSQKLQQHTTSSSNQSRKLEHGTSGEHTNAHCQNSPVPHQQLNFALVPSASMGGGGGVDLVPSQAFAMSFASFAGNNKASNLNFSSMSQNPTIVHSLPEMARQGYHVTSVPQAAQQKNHQISDGKSGSGSTNMDDREKASSGKSHTTNGQTYIFDNSARSLNFVSSPGNWPPCSITSTTVSINPPIVANSSSSHQQLVQHQKQHMTTQLHHQQPATASRNKTQTTNPMPASSIAGKFSSNAANFPQTVPQSNPAAQANPWKNSARTPASSATNVKSFPQQPLRPPQGQTQISFGVNTKSGIWPQRQEIPTAASLHRL